MPRVIISCPDNVVRVHQRAERRTIPWHDVVNGGNETDFWQASGQLNMYDVDTGHKFSAHCVAYELPTVTSAVVLQVELGDDGHSLVKRPVPLYSMGHAAAARSPPSPASFVFDERCAQAEYEALGRSTLLGELGAPNTQERFFLARYMPMSETVFVLNHAGLFDRATELLKRTPWVLFLEGYIDHQGLEQALVDFQLTDALLLVLSTNAVPEAMYWGHLLRLYVEIDTRLAVSGTPTIHPQDDFTTSTLAILEKLGVMVRDAQSGAYISKLQQSATSIIRQIVATYMQKGRVPAEGLGGSSIREAFARSDILFFDLMARYRLGIVRELDAIVSNALMVLRRDDAADQSAVRARYAQALQVGNTRYPVIVIQDAHTWSTSDLVRVFLPLFASRQLAANGRFTLTRSGVPFQLLFVYNSAENATVWMRAMFAAKILSTNVFFPRLREMTAISSCPIYSAMCDTIHAMDTNIQDAFLATCRRLVADNPGASNPDALVCPMHANSNVTLCRALPCDVGAMDADDRAQVEKLRSGLHLEAGHDIHVALRTHPGELHSIFLYPDAKTGAMPHAATVCTAICEAPSVFLVAEPRELFPTFADLFAQKIGQGAAP